MTERKLRVTLMGIGRIGRHHVRTTELQKCANLVAVVDPALYLDMWDEQLPPGIKLLNRIERR